MAPNKKYLSLEDAAIQLGVQPEELIRLREKGEVRGFADRGTWKFKADDIAEYRRRQQPDSDPDLRLIDEDEDEIDEPPVERPSRNLNSDSDVRLILADDPQMKRLSGSSADLKTIDMMKSDSDVRLVEAPEPKKGSDSDVKLVKPKSPSKVDSDSDVKMMDLHHDDSDSDVKLLDSSVGIDSDSDVRLAQSDSDVRLAPLAGSDSDVKLASKKPSVEDDSDSDVILLPRGSKHRTDPLQETDLEPLADSDSLDFNLGDDSAVLAGDSGIMLAGDDSDIKLAGEDSGIRLAGDSGIRLSQDSGVQLMQPADSGISLEGQDSGIRFANSGMTLDDSSGVSGGKKKGGKKRPPSDADLDDLDMTNPMLLSDSGEDDDLGAVTNALSFDDEDDAGSVEFEELEARDTSELQALGDSGNDIVIFDDEEDVSTMAEGKAKRKSAGESLFELDEADDEVLEELEVSDEELSGESDYEELPFDDGDELSEYSEGTSQTDIVVPRKAVVQEAEWSAGVLGLLFTSLSLMIVGALVSSDLLRTVWGTSQESSVDNGIAWLLSSLWK